MTSKSKVYYVSMRSESQEENLENKLKKLFDAAGFGDFIHEGDLTAVKVHFGEHGNTTFVHPWNVRVIIDKIKEKGALPFLTDSTTLYVGKRKNAVLHIMTAIRHGFSYPVVDAPVIIADGLRGRLYKEIEINKKHFKKVKIAPIITESDNMIVISHFKGHVMAGFGGAIKNLAMGCASSEGKKDQHAAVPFANEEKCVGCGICMETCPTNAITIRDGIANVNADLCIGCGECISHCPNEAMKLNWETDIPEFMERMTEYAYGAWSIFRKKDKQGDLQNKIGFINFAVNITPDCDCLSWSDTPIVNDIGILASTDPVALDKACYDLVNSQPGRRDSALESGFDPGEDKFKALNEDLKGEIQLFYGEEIGLGSTDYELIKI